MPRRSESLRTRHLSGVAHGQDRLPGPVVVPATQLDPGPPPVITRVEASRRGLVTEDVLVEALGLTHNQVRRRINEGRLVPAARVRMVRGASRAKYLVGVYDLPGC